MYVDRLTLVGGKIPQGGAYIKHRWPEEDYRATIRLTQDSSSRKAAHLRLMDSLFEEILCDRPLMIDGKCVQKPGASYCVSASAGWIGYIAHHHKDMPENMRLGSRSGVVIPWCAVSIFEGDTLAETEAELDIAVHWLLDGAIQSTSAVDALAVDLLRSFNRIYKTLYTIKEPSPAVLTCPECPHWGLMTGRCSKTGLTRGTGDVCAIPKGGTNVR